MKFKLALSTATALGLMMGAAMANDNIGVIVQGTATIDSTNSTALIDQDGGQNNRSKFTQLGDSNNAFVTQDGNNNQAGRHLQFTNTLDTSPALAFGYNFMTQNGDNNNLVIDQSSNGNSVAIDGNLQQIGNRNNAEITQVGKASSGNRVNSVTQTDSTGTASALTNSLVVNQSGAGDGSVPGLSHSDYNYTPNLITSVQQTWTGVGAGAANTLTITQTGAVHARGNTVSSAVQNGTGNTGTITQTGRSNNVSLLSQTGIGNTASLTFTGDSNGTTGFTGAPANEILGVTQGQAIQNGDRNQLAYDVLGNSNLFAFNQQGSDNRITGTVIGDDNEVAVLQSGNVNYSFTQQFGGNNNIGISQ